MRSWVKFGIDRLQRGVIGLLKATTPGLISKSNYRSTITPARFLQISLSLLNLASIARYTVLHTLRSEKVDSRKSREELRRIKRKEVEKGTRKVKLRIIQIKTDR